MLNASMYPTIKKDNPIEKRATDAMIDSAIRCIYDRGWTISISAVAEMLYLHFDLCYLTANESRVQERINAKLPMLSRRAPDAPWSISPHLKYQTIAI